MEAGTKGKIEEEKPQCARGYETEVVRAEEGWSQSASQPERTIERGHKSGIPGTRYIAP